MPTNIQDDELVYEMRPHSWVERTLVGGYWLSRNDVTILRGITAGLTNAGIAREMGLNTNTVTNRTRELYVRIDSINRATAAAFTIRHGLSK